jgi:bis(5'-nucleosyl)-tetraphosphatase (symmetrical)
MSTYAIGDIQGCFTPLQKLLDKIHFDPAQDKLWLTGDLVNRGPESLQALRFIKNLGKSAQIVLGNHDLHLLAMSYEMHPGWREDTVAEILNAPDRKELMDWLRHQPLLHHDEKLGFTMVHAGLASSWDLQTARELAHEVEKVLQSENAKDFFQHMYGNLPDQWDPQLKSFDRLRCITNFFTRARFCHADGRLELESKGKINSSDLTPWFNVSPRANENLKIIFGHWAALGGVTNVPNAIALDTGCVWGFCLTAMRLEDGERFSVSCGS